MKMRKYLSLFLIIMAFSVNYAIAQDSVSNEETVFTFTVGSFKVSTLSEGGGNGNSDLLSGVTEEMLKRYLPDGTFSIQTNAFLVQTDNKTVLIDTGYGKNLFSNLKSLNITEGQVDVVLLTHMHGDHIGGLLKDGKAAFPNAKLYVSQAEHDYWINTDNNATARDIFTAYKTNLHLFEPVDLDSDKQNLFAGFQGIKAYGHTPGHTVFMVESNEDRLLIWGDIAHAMDIQMPHPEVTISFDVDPVMAKESRSKVLEYAVKNKIRIAGMHLLFPSTGSVTTGETQGAAYIFTPNLLP